jgi:hypothetical protein
MTALYDGSDLLAWVRAYRRHDLLNQAGKACCSRTAISFSTSGTGSGWSMLKRKAPDEVAYPVSSSLSCGKDRAAVGEIAQMILKRGEPGDCLSPDLEGGHAVGDPLVGR